MAEIPISIKPVDYVVQKWRKRAEAAVEDYRIRVQSPKRDPIKAALSMKETLMRKMALRETWDKWEQKLGAWTLEAWAKRASTIGAERFPGGIAAGELIYRQFYEQFSKHLAEGLAKVYALPRVTLEDSIRRAAEMIRHNAKFRFLPKPA